MQDECLSATVAGIFGIVGWVPGVVGEGGQSFTNLGADDSQGVLFVVTMLMKLGCLELMFGCFEKEGQFLRTV